MCRFNNLFSNKASLPPCRYVYLLLRWKFMGRRGMSQVGALHEMKTVSQIIMVQSDIQDVDFLSFTKVSGRIPTHTKQKIRSPSGIEVESCIKAESPSSQNRKCRQFHDSMGDETMPKKGESILIMYGKSNKKTICYDR